MENTDAPPAAELEPVQTPLNAPPPGESDHSAANIMARFQAMQAEAKPAEPTEQPHTEPKPDAAPKSPTQGEEGEELTPEELAEAEDMPGPKTKKSVSKWAEIKSELKKAKAELGLFREKELPKKDQELAELRTKLEELSKHDPELYQKQIEEREKAISEYEKKLAIYDIRESKAWQDTVSKPSQEIGATLDNISKAYEIDYTVLAQAVAEQDPSTQRRMLAPLLEGMDQVDVLDVRDAIRKAREISSKAAELEENAFKAKEELEFLKDQESRKQAEETAKKRSLAAQAVEQQFREKLPQLFQDEELAKKVFSASLETDDPAMQAYNSYAGAMLLDVVKQNMELRKSVEEFKAAEEKRRSAKPQAGGAPGVSGGAVDATQRMPEGETVWDRFKAAQAARS